MGRRGADQDGGASGFQGAATEGRKGKSKAELDMSKLCASTGISFTGQITTFRDAERLQQFELAVRTALEAVQFLPKPVDALERGQLRCNPPCNDRSELVERMSSAHRILAQRLRNLGARPLPSVRLNRKEQAQHLQQWIAAKLEKNRIASVPDLFTEYFEENKNVVHECYALSRHAFWQHFSEVIQSYWYTSTDYKGRLTAYYNDPSQPKVPVRIRGNGGWETRKVGILKPCRSREFLQHSKGYDREHPDMSEAQTALSSPKNRQPSSPEGSDKSPKRFFVPLQANNILPTRGPDLDFAATSPPSARRRLHSGIPLSYRSPRAVELVRTAWSRALHANVPQESASSVEGLAQLDFLDALNHENVRLSKEQNLQATMLPEKGLRMA